MAKRKKRVSHAVAEEKKQEQREADRKVAYANLARLGGLIATTAVIFLLYRFLINTPFVKITLAAYLVAATAVILTYVIYNRGFSRKGITPDMLPDTMSVEQKKEFIEDGERRLKRSRPLLAVIFAFSFTFVYDIIELVAIPFVKELFR